MQNKLNMEEVISSIKREALEAGVYRDTMENTFDQLRRMVAEIENPRQPICKGKWDVYEYLLSLIKIMSENYWDMFMIVDALTNERPGSHFEILWNHDGALWDYKADDHKRYERKFVVEIYEENGGSVPYLYEEV